MIEKEKEELRKKYREPLKRSYEELYEEDPDQYEGAVRISDRLQIPEEERGHNCYEIHGILLELKEEGFLEQDLNYGFRLSKRKSNPQPLDFPMDRQYILKSIEIIETRLKEVKNALGNDYSCFPLPRLNDCCKRNLIKALQKCPEIKKDQGKEAPEGDL